MTEYQLDLFDIPTRINTASNRAHTGALGALRLKAYQHSGIKAHGLQWLHNLSAADQQQARQLLQQAKEVQL